MTSQAPRSAEVSSTPAAGPQSDALRGASLAFQSRAARSAPPQPPSTTANGALVAATSAASASTPQNGLSRHATGGSTASDRSAFSLEHHTLSHQLSQLQPSPQSGSHLRPSDARPGPDTRSASFIAATLAASRSASPSPNRQRAGRGSATPRGHRAGTPSAASPPPSLRLYLDRDRVYTSNADGDRPVRDITSPQEPQFPAPDPEWRGREDTDPVKSPPPESANLRAHPEDGRRRDASDETQAQDSPTKRPLKLKPKPGPKPRPDSIRTKASVDSGPDPTTAGTNHGRDDASSRETVREKIPTPASRAATAIDSRPSSHPTQAADDRASATGPTPPPPRRHPASVSQPTARGSSATEKASTRRGVVASNQDERTGSLGRDVDGPGTIRAVARARAGSESSDDTFFTTSSGRSGPAPSPPAQNRAEPGVVGRLRPKTPPPRSSASGQRQAAAAATHTRAVNHNGPGLALDSLTNAIVASNLASARRQPASGESRAPPPIPVPRRKQRNDPQPPPWASGPDLSRSYSKSPPKRSGMLQTLRSPPSKSDDEESRRNRERYRKRSSLGKKHVHHEGSRRRWREQLTAAERRRYAALWASNRGLLLAAPQQGSEGSGPDQDSVANVVVRDLWGRSRLPFDELAEVWDLVDLGRRGMLSKEEFVVGTWLVDQRLRGRKIPARVSQSVWDSVKGLKVPAPGSSG
ncbi:hypothetical protein RB595_001234 [Gaeumannomyces hyphopodioides]